MKKLCLSAFLLISLLFSGCQNEPTSPSSHTATVQKVVDGDTIHLTEPILETTKVRLLSIDAPETNYRGEKQSPWGEESKKYLQQLLPSGSEVTIILDSEKKDSYGRLLAHIQKDQLNINQQMLKKGHAVTYFIYPNQKYFKRYQATYLDAKKAKRGMWDEHNPIKELPFEFRNRISNQPQDKYVGNYYDKTYVQPQDYKQIPVENRIFFFDESDAQKAGYTEK